MRDLYGSTIYWHETRPHLPRPALAGRLDVDVAVVGGGFTGLWTAYHLLEADPSLRVAVLEREEIGFGASGRNGGFAMTLLDMGLAHLRRNHGDAAARAAHLAVAGSVEEIGTVVERHGIDCEWVHGGLMVVATNEAQLARVRADLAAAEALDLPGFRALSAEETRAEVHSPTYLGGLLEDHCAVLNPSRLARGLADVVERMGATVLETTDVTAIDEAGARMRVASPGGEVTAEQVVLATNAWAVATSWFEAKVLPLYTYVLVTEPLTDAQWASVGWERRQGIEDKRNYVHYYRRTADGRILWGGTDGVVHAHHRRRPSIRPDYDRHRGVARKLASTFRRTFPQLAGVRFTHHWGGPVGITARFVPLFGTLVPGRLHYGLGYNGHGVAPTHTGGKILRDRVLGKAGDLSELCFVDAREPAFPPEPLRWISAELTRRALLRQDRQMDEGRPGAEMDPLLLRLMSRLG
ncbi:MAG: FAD-binding oxidoreductase [Acidimicrobiia bacterium]|nr:FAD-binding oxidoreductase [Acidimicrobiia bacterium]